MVVTGTSISIHEFLQTQLYLIYCAQSLHLFCVILCLCWSILLFFIHKCLGLVVFLRVWVFGLASVLRGQSLGWAFGVRASVLRGKSLGWAFGVRASVLRGQSLGWAFGVRASVLRGKILGWAFGVRASVLRGQSLGWAFGVRASVLVLPYSGSPTPWCELWCMTQR